MQERVVVQLLEGLQLDAQTLAIVEQSVVVIGNAPRAGIEIQVLVELAFLRRAAAFGIGAAASQRPVAAPGTAVEFQNLHLVAGLTRFQRAGPAGTSNAHTA